MFRIILSIMLVISIAGCDGSVGNAEQAVEQNEVPEARVSYNPGACKIDAEGMVYFALGREVFRQPYQEGMSIRGMSDEDRAILAPHPDPREPEGCPDNPLRGSNFGISYRHYPKNPEKFPDGTLFRAKTITLIELPERFKNSTVEVAKWGLQPSLEKDFESVRARYDSCEKLDNGLTACRVPEAGREILSLTTKFQADPDIYDTPFGRRFTVSCLAWPIVDRQDCDVSYNYSEDTRVSYKFELHELPPLEIIEFDKGLREKIESMRVINFRWADE